MASKQQQLITILSVTATIAVVIAIGIAGMEAANRLGPTHQEPSQITAGLALWRAGEGIGQSGKPPLTLLLQSIWLNLHWAGSVADWPGLPEHDLERMTAEVLTDGTQVMEMLWWARLPGILATALTAAFVFWGARALWRSNAAGLLAAVVYGLAPSTLAHAARADGMALTTLCFVGALAFGWRRLHGRGRGWPSIALALMTVVLDWSVWVFIPPILVILFAEWLERLGFRLHFHLTGANEAPLLKRVGGSLGEIGHHLWRSAGAIRLLLGRAALGLILFWFVMVELTGDWHIWRNMGTSFTAHWHGRFSEVQPLYFHGNFYPSRPLLYHPTILLLKTPLWLFALWALAAIRTEAWRGPMRRRALIHGHLILAWGFLFGSWVLPARGYEVWVPLIPFICMMAGGAIRPPTLVSNIIRPDHWLRIGAVACLVGFAAMSAWTNAPHWHARWNLLARVSGGGRAWFAAPELDGGPAMPDAAEIVNAELMEDEILFLAPRSRWSPEALGLEGVLLEGHGMVLEPSVSVNPTSPVPGLYLIASSPLVGQNLLSADAYRWFREHEPMQWIGGTLGVWRVGTMGNDQ